MAVDLFDHDRAFRSVIDLTALRLRDLPLEEDEGGDTAGVTPEQAGRGEGVVVSLRRSSGRWHGLVPGHHRLRAMRDRLEASARR